MLKLTLLITTFFGVYGLECPDVNSLHCLGKRTVTDKCRVQTYIKMEDGTKCPGCDICIQPSSSPYCPPIPCPLWDMDPSCIDPKFYRQTFDTDTVNDCRACETFVCR